MKKTMFITSVIMVVVLAIALTTSSLAWFSAGGAQTVSTNSITVSAVEAQTVGAGLEISHDNSIWTTAAISLLHPVKVGNEDAANYVSASGYYPACPVGAFTSNTTSGGTVANDEAFYEAILAMRQSKIATIATVPSFVEDSTAAGLGVGFYRDTLYLRNSGTTDTYANLVLTASASTHAGAGNEDLRDATMWVAVFAVYRENDIVSSVELLGLESSKTASYMTYAQNQAALDGSLASPIAASTVTDVNGVSKSGLLGLRTNVQLAGGSNGAATFNYGTPVEIEVYAWFDGNSLYAQNRDTVISIGITFNKVAAANTNL